YFLCTDCRDHPGFHSFPTRRSSDLASDILRDLLRVQTLITPGNIEFIDEISITFSRESLYDAVHALRDTLGGDMYVDPHDMTFRSEEHTSELQSRENLVCRLLLEKK